MCRLLALVQEFDCFCQHCHVVYAACHVCSVFWFKICLSCSLSISGMYHIPLLLFFFLFIISFPLWSTVNLLSLKMTLHPAWQSLLMENIALFFSMGIVYPSLAVCGSLGRPRVLLWVDSRTVPSGMVTQIGSWSCMVLSAGACSVK